MKFKKFIIMKIIFVIVLIALLCNSSQALGGLDSLLGKDGLVGSLLGPNGIVGSLLGPNGIIGSLLGEKGLVGGLLNSVLGDVLGGKNGTLNLEGLLKGLGVREIVENVLKSLHPLLPKELRESVRLLLNSLTKKLTELLKMPKNPLHVRKLKILIRRELDAVDSLTGQCPNEEEEKEHFM